MTITISQVDTEIDSISVPINVTGLVVGKGKSNFYQLQQIYKVNLRVYYGVSFNHNQQIQGDNEADSNSIQREITIRGSRENIDKVKALIRQIVTDKSDDCIRLLQQSRDGYERLPIPNDKVGLVIGKNGAPIKELMSKTHTQVQVPKTPDEKDPNTRTLVITGDPNDVLMCKREILEIVAGKQGHIDSDRPITTYDVPDDKVGLIVGKKGSIIQDIQQKTNAQIEIPGLAVEGSNPPVRYLFPFSL